MPDTVFIYALKCPITGRTRYVGKTNNPAQRLASHLSEKLINHRTNWIKSLKALGQTPLLEILDEVPDAEWQQWEVAWIEFYREQGFDLVNGTLGGEGSNGIIFSEEARARISAANTGKHPSEETRAKMSVSQLGRKHSAETRAKIGAGNVGKQHYSAERLAKMSAASTGKHPSAETRAKQSAAIMGENNHFFGKHHSAEAIAKNRAAHLGKRHSAETRAKMSAAKQNISDEICAKMSAARLGKKRGPYKKKKLCQQTNPT